MKLLVVVPAFLSSKPEAIRYRSILEFLKYEHDIHVLCLSNRTKSKEVDGINIHEIPCSPLGILMNSDSLFRFLLRPFRFDPQQFEAFILRSKVTEIIQSESIDLVIGSAAPFVTLQLGQICRKNHIPFIYDIGDPFYNNPYIGWIRNKLAYLYESIYLNYVDHLIVITEDLRQSYLNNFNHVLSPEDISVVEMGMSIPRFEKKKFINSPINITYAGRFYRRLRDPSTVFRAIENFHSKTLLNVYSQSSHFKELQSDTIKFFNEVPYEMLPQIYEKADIILFIDNAYGIQMPSKLFEILALNRPVLFVGGRETTARKIAKKHEYVFLAENTMESIQDQLEKIINEYSELRFNKDALASYTWEQRAWSLNTLLSSFKSRRVGI